MVKQLADKEPIPLLVTICGPSYELDMRKKDVAEPAELCSLAMSFFLIVLFLLTRSACQPLWLSPLPRWRHLTIMAPFGL